MLNLIPGFIPASLKSVPNWCLWHETKIPKSTSNRPQASNKVPWESYQAIISAYDEGGWDGIGFCLTDTGIVGIDLDHCYNDDNTLKLWGKRIVEFFSGHYMERSPSGKGLHILVRGVKTTTHCRRALKDGEVEVYDTARYLTVTGQLLPESSAEIKEGQRLIDDFIETLWPPRTNEETTNEKIVAQDTAPANPQNVVELIKGSSQAVKFLQLTTGTLESACAPFGGNHSRAVQALCAIVSWWTGDFAEMDRIFRGSPLHCGKWAPDSEGYGRAKAGKWQATGRTAFDKLRAGYAARGEVYSGGGGGRVPPEVEFSSVDSGGSQGGKAVNYDAHVALLHEFGETRRDLLSEALHIKRENDKWEPVFNRSFIAAIRGECRSRGGKLRAPAIEDLLHKYEQSLDLSMLIDVPEWDGEDRIANMCSKMRLESVPLKTYTDIFKDWCAKMWLKIEEPERVQNRCILLSGQQGIGKDVWVRSLFCGLDRYLSDLVTNGRHTTEADLSVVMGQSLVLFVSEFDKTESLGPGILKDLVTKPSFTSVRKYDREATTTFNRCSVIAACNPEHVLSDTTGNRRFLLFRLAGGPGEAIEWSYPTYDRAYSGQVLAQCKALAAEKYVSSRESEECMRQIQAEHTPESTESLIVADFEAAVMDRVSRDSFDGENIGLFRISELDTEFSQLSKNHAISRRQLLTTLKAAGCQKRKSEARYYGTRAAVLASDDTHTASTGVSEEDWI